MRCVQCGHLEDKVIDSRMSKDGTTIRRRRDGNLQNTPNS